VEGTDTLASVTGSVTEGGDNHMLAVKNFFSFAEIPDPALHRAYNEWHQLDHRPENLALPGVAWGERWVRTPRCAAVSTTGTELAGLHYANLYWFAAPASESVAGWEDLAERAFQWGRRDDIHIVTRLLMTHVRPIAGRVSPRLQLSAEALPFRPNRGIVLSVTRVDQPRSAAAELRFGWWQRDYVPAQLERPGVAGCWTFTSLSTFAVHADLSSTPPPPSVRFVVHFLDEDPVDTFAAFDPLEPDPVESVLFHGPLEVIHPWAWDWFEAS